MSSPTYPGVYVTEAPGGARPVAAVGTSTAAFVGLTEWGPSNTAVRLTNWSDYQRQFGSFIPNSYLAQSVFAFFSNGGTQCYVVRAGDPGHTASVVVKNEKDVDGMRFFAAHPGTAGNALVLTLGPGSAAPGSELKITVSRGSTVTDGSPGALVPLEVYDNLSMDPRSPSFLPTALSRSAIVRAEVEPGNTAVQPGALIGGARPVLPLEEAGAVPDTQVARHRMVSVNVNGDGWQDVELGPAALSSADVAVAAEELQSRVRALKPLRASTPADAYSSFTVSVQDDGGVLLLTAGAVTGAGPTVTSSVEVRAVPADDASRMLKLLSVDGARGRGPFAERRPHPALKQVHLGDEPDGAHIGTVVAGTDGADPVDSDFTTAFHALDTITDVSLLAAPGEGSPSMVSAGMDYCAGRSLQDVFFVGEMGVNDVSLDDALQFRQRIPTPSSYGAVYFPWIQATDPSGISANPLLLPPSGFICGLCARTDATRGVWKAPAGTSAGLRGSIGLTAELTDIEHGVLNLQDVNVIRQFPGTGIVAFGARTLAAAEPEWRYVPVRRTAIMLRTSIYQGIQWAVFEPNDETLWAQLRLSIRSFMMRLFRQGAFKGATPDQAFFVKCDAETTTQDDIDLGIVNVKVGFAPLKPAEFVIVTVSQQAGQSA